MGPIGQYVDEVARVVGNHYDTVFVAEPGRKLCWASVLYIASFIQFFDLSISLFSLLAACDNGLSGTDHIQHILVELFIAKR